MVPGLGSDHNPVLVEARDRASTEGGPRARVWNWKKAKWEGFRAEVRKRIGRVQWVDLTVTEWEKRFREIVLGAARRWVGMRVLRKGEEEVVSGEVLGEMERRDRLKADNEVDWEAVDRAEERIKELVKEERVRRWRGLVAKGASHKEMWGVSRRLGPGKGKGGRWCMRGVCWCRRVRRRRRL